MPITNLTITHQGDDFPQGAGLPNTRLAVEKSARYLEGFANGAKPGSRFTIAGHAVAGTATITPAATGANVADTFTLNGTVFTLEQEMARGTVTCASALAADTVTVQAVVFTAVSGTPVGNQFDISGTDTAAATSLKAAINANATLALILTATSAAAVVTLRAIASGVGGNAYTLATSNNTRLAKSATTLLGGIATSNNKLDNGDTQAQTAAEVARAVTASTSGPVTGLVTCTATSTVDTFTLALAGTAGKMASLTSSNGTRLAVSATPFQNAASDTIQSFTR